MPCSPERPLRSPQAMANFGQEDSYEEKMRSCHIIPGVAKNYPRKAPELTAIGMGLLFVCDMLCVCDVLLFLLGRNH